MTPNPQYAKDYVEKFADMMDMMVVRHETLGGGKPSSHKRLLYRNQVMEKLEPRFPKETADYRKFMAWMNGVTGSDFRQIPKEEIPSDLLPGYLIYNTLRGKLAAKARYRNKGLEAYGGKKNKVTHDEAEDTLMPLVQATQTAEEKSGNREVGYRRYLVALDRCHSNGFILPVDAVVGLLLGVEPSVVTHWRNNARQYAYASHADGGFVVILAPQQTLLEKVTDKLQGLSEEELESLRQLLSAAE